MGKSKAPSSNQTSTSKMEPWQAAQGELKNVISEVAAQYQRTGGATPEWIEKNYPDLTPEMKSSLASLTSSGQITSVADQLASMGQQGTSNVSTAASQLQSMATGGSDITAQQVGDLSSQLYDAESVRAQKQELASDLNKQYQQNVSGLNLNAAGSGNMGSSRAGVAQAVMAGNEQEALAKGASAIEIAGRQAAQQQAIGIIGQNTSTRSSATGALANLGMQQSQLGAQSAQLYQQALQNQYTAAQTGQQQAIAQAENQYYNQYGAQNAGWENLARYQSMMTQLGGMGGSSTATSKAPSAGGQSTAMGALGGAASGAAMGTAIMPGWGTAIGAVAGGVMGAFSDASLKDRVKLVGKTQKGENVYDWEWNGKGRKKGLKGKSSGVLAQDIAKTKPQAVGKRGGALTVDYKQTSVKKPK